MFGPLQAAKEYIERRYRVLYGVQKFSSFDEQESISSDLPSWIWQDAELRPCRNESDATGSLLLDPEIGLGLYLLVFDRQTPVRVQVSRALELRSKLLPSKVASNTADHDQFGPWSISICWMIEEAARSSWIKQVAELREWTKHFEEVPIDIVINATDDWTDACHSHQFPRLLISTRDLLRKNEHEALTWQSADKKILEELEGLSAVFEEQAEQYCARETESFINEELSDSEFSQANFSRIAGALRHVSVRNFRNISSIDLVTGLPESKVTASVVHGPNGSGKSSIFEAICVGVFGTSSRYQKYLKSGNRSFVHREDRYVLDYLTNIRDGSKAPAVGVNEEDPREVVLSSTNLSAIHSNVLSQEDSEFLVNLSAEELGTEIAKSQSQVAEKISSFVESKFQSAQSQLRSFNEEWGLRGNVTRTSTVVSHLCARELENRLPKTRELRNWLGEFSNSSLPNSNRARDLLSHWSEFDSEIELCCKKVGSDSQSSFHKAQLVHEILDHFNALASRCEDFLFMVSEVTQAWPNNLESDLTKALSQYNDSKESEPQPAANSDQIEALRSRLEEEEAIGRLNGDYVDHLDRTKGFLDRWPEHFQAGCPTCESNLEERGGTRKVVDQLAGAKSSELELNRRSYRDLREELQVLEKGEAGGAAFAVEEELARIFEWLSPLLSQSDFDRMVESEQFLLRRWFALFLRLPNVRLVENPSEMSDEIIGKVLEIKEKHEQLTDLPSAWRSVRSHVSSRLSEITAGHLPGTLQMVWLEIASNLMPARWQYPSLPFIRVEEKQRTPFATIQFESGENRSLAEFILNAAEAHNLGLAWFLTRFVSQGRFQSPLLLVDDPAQSMDEPTFRDLCRLFSTLLRLAKKRDSELNLVLLLHNDRRASTAAREFGGLFSQLQWHQGSATAVVKPVLVKGVDTVNPDPSVLLRAS